MQAPYRNLDEVSSLLRPLLSPEVTFGVTDPRAPHPAPFREELDGLSKNALDKRKREFSAGRFAVHQAMRALKQPVDPVPIGPNRAPVWPERITGSITHCRSCAIAATSLRTIHAGLGLDVEEDTPLEENLWPSICTEAEREWLRTLDRPGEWGKVIFSAKEAAYKAQYTVSSRYFGFDGMELRFDLEASNFVARFTAAQPPFDAGYELAGRFARGGDLIITAVEIRAEDVPGC